MKSILIAFISGTVAACCCPDSEPCGTGGAGGTTTSSSSSSGMCPDEGDIACTFPSSSACAPFADCRNVSCNPCGGVVVNDAGSPDPQPGFCSFPWSPCDVVTCETTICDPSQWGACPTCDICVQPVGAWGFHTECVYTGDMSQVNSTGWQCLATPDGGSCGMSATPPILP